MSSSILLVVNQVRTNTFQSCKVTIYYEEICLKFVVLFFTSFIMVRVFEYNTLLTGNKEAYQKNYHQLKLNNFNFQFLIKSDMRTGAFIKLLNLVFFVNRLLYICIKHW